MNICFITHYGELYGANRSLLDMCDGLSQRKKNVKITVIGPKKGEIIAEIQKRKIEYIKIGYCGDVFSKNTNKKYLSNKALLLCVRFIEGIIKNFNNLGSVIYLYQKLRKQNIDIFHTNSSITFLGAYLSLLLNKCHVWHIREFVYESYSFQYYFGKKFFQYLVKKSFPIAISKSIYNKRLLCVSPERKKQLYNGIIWEKDIFENRNRENRNDDEIHFGIVGEVSKVKNQKEAIEAFKLLHIKYSNTKLFVVGKCSDIIYEQNLKKYIQEINLKEVFFTGHIEDIPSIYSRIDVLLMCSEYEALGRVTIEAMARGIPVIGYNNAGTSEIIEDNVNSFLYSGSYIQLFDKMSFLLNSDLHNISQKAKETVRKKFTIEQYTDDIYSFYLECLKVSNK